MSLVKITELPTSTGLNATTDYVPIVHNGVTQKITPQALYNLALTAPGAIGSVTPPTIAGTIITGTTLTISSTATITTLNTGAAINTGNGVTTGAAYLELGGLRTGSGNSYIDFHSTSGTDFESRLIRNSGTNGALELYNTGTGGFNILTSVSATSVLANGAGGLGYSTGTGIAVTQLTSRTTTVPTTGTKFCGAITLFSVAPVVGTWFSFVVPNTSIAVTDNVIVSVRNGSNTYVAMVSGITAATSFRISMQSILGTTIDAPIVNFTILKSVSA